MPQEFQVLQCYSCRTFQVHQVKKAKKWACKMCGEKQSVIKVYGVGTGAECRQHVQKLNTHRGEVESLKETLPCNESRPFPTDMTTSTSDGPIDDGSGNKWGQFVEPNTSQSDDTMYSDQDCENDRFTTDASLLDKRKMSRKRKFQSYQSKAQKTTSSKYEDFMEHEEDDFEGFDRRALSYVDSNSNKHRHMEDGVRNNLRQDSSSLSYEHNGTNTNKDRNIRGDVTNDFPYDRRNLPYIQGNKYRRDGINDEETSNMTYDRVIKRQPVQSKPTKSQRANDDFINEKLPDKDNYGVSSKGSNMHDMHQDTTGIVTSSNSTVFQKKVNQFSDTSQSKWSMYSSAMEPSSQSSLEEDDTIPLANTELDTRPYVELGKDVLESIKESEKRNFDNDTAPEGLNHRSCDTRSSKWGKFIGMNDETDIHDVKEIPSTNFRKDDGQISKFMISNCDENEIPPSMQKNALTNRDEISTKPHGVFSACTKNVDKPHGAFPALTKNTDETHDVFPSVTKNRSESIDSNTNVVQNKVSIIQDSKCFNSKQHIFKQGRLNQLNVEGGSDSAQFPLKPMREERVSQRKPSLTFTSASVRKPDQVASLFSVGDITDEDLEL